MLKSKQRDGSDPFAMADEPLKTRPLSISVPDVHETMRLAGVMDLRSDPKQRNSRLLCCCGEPGCRIGPMTQVQETEA